MIEIYPAIKNHHKPAIKTFKSVDGVLTFDRYRFGETVDIGPVTMENPDSEFLDLSIMWASNILHWLVDVLPGALFALNFDAGVCKKTVLLEKGAGNCFYVNQYLRLLGFSKWKIKESEKLPTTVSQPLTHTSLVHPFVVENLRRFIRQASKDYPINPETNLLIQRSVQGSEKSESRNFENRDEIMERFDQAGLPLTMVYLEGLPVVQQIAMFAQPQIIIGAHGAGLAGIMFCRQDCKFIEVASPHFWNSPYAEIAGQLGLKFSVLTGKMVNQDPLHPLYRYGLNVSPEHLLELL